MSFPRPQCLLCLCADAVNYVSENSAWVWGSSVKHQPKKCGKEHVLCDEDVVQIVKKVG